MVTKFQLMDAVGKVLARGEIDNNIYRVFSKQLPGGYQEFDDLQTMFDQCGGVGIQPELFETSAETQQLDVFQEKK